VGFVPNLAIGNKIIFICDGIVSAAAGHALRFEEKQQLRFVALMGRGVLRLKEVGISMTNRLEGDVKSHPQSPTAKYWQLRIVELRFEIGF